MSTHNHCQVMWPSALGCNEQLITWRDGYIYMFWVWSVLSSPEPSWQQCQMQTCTLKPSFMTAGTGLFVWIWSTVAALKQAHQAVRTGCVFVQGWKKFMWTSIWKDWQIRYHRVQKHDIIGPIYSHGDRIGPTWCLAISSKIRTVG